MSTIRLKYRPSSVAGKEGTLFFQIIHKRQVRQLYTGLYILPQEWNEAAGCVCIPARADADRARYLTALKRSLDEIRDKLSLAVAQLEGAGSPYTARDVVAAFRGPTKEASTGLVAYTRSLIEDMREIGKRAAVKRLKATLSSLLRYTQGREVAWAELCPTFMLGYEELLKRRGLCRNSTSFYMRNLRAVINRAGEQDLAVPRNPFRHVYTGVDKTKKRAVPLETIRMIRDIDLSGSPQLDFARNLFMFAFYTRGMAFIDIALLKKSDLRNGVITYSRRKTRHQLAVRIEPETRRIIKCLGRSDTSYLLPIITDEATDWEPQYTNAYCRVNRNVQKVGQLIGLVTKLTLYVARHSWASAARAKGIPLPVISEGMGHDSEATTQIYLSSLDSSVVDRANSLILKALG